MMDTAEIFLFIAAFTVGFFFFYLATRLGRQLSIWDYGFKPKYEYHYDKFENGVLIINLILVLLTGGIAIFY